MKNDVIKLSNKFVMGKFNMSLNTQKLFFYTVKILDNEKEDFNILEFYLKDFAEYSKLDIKYLYGEIYNMTSELMRTIIHIKENDEKWKKYNLTNSCSYDKGKIVMLYSQTMKPFLLNLKDNYTKLLAHFPMDFTKKYSSKFFIICKSVQYKNPPVIEFTIDELRDILCIEKDKYKCFYDLKRFVIEPALEDINKLSDIQIEYECTRTRPKRVIFYIEKKISYADIFENISNIDELKEKAGIIDLKASSDKILDIYSIAVKKTENEIISPFKYIRLNYEYMLKKDKVRNDVAYLKTCVERDYGKAIYQVKYGLINFDVNEDEDIDIDIDINTEDIS